MADEQRIAELEALHAELKSEFFGAVDFDGQAHDMPDDARKAREKMDAVEAELARLRKAD